MSTPPEPDSMVQSRRGRPDLDPKPDAGVGPALTALSGGAVRVRVGGPLEGPAVLFVHGLSYPLDVFTPVVDLLQLRGFRTVQFDLYGRGEATWNGTPLTVENLAASALEVLDALHIDKVESVVSLSNSDLVINALATSAPERVARLVWLAPSGNDPRTMRWSMRWPAAVPIVRRLFGWFLRRRCVERMRGHLTHLPETAPNSARQAYQVSIRTARENPHFAPAVVSFLRHLPRLPAVVGVVRRLAGTGLPVLSVEFADERDTTEDNLLVFQDNLPTLQRLVLPGTHMGLLENPERVADGVANFLRGDAPGPTTPQPSTRS